MAPRAGDNWQTELEAALADACERCGDVLRLAEEQARAIETGADDELSPLAQKRDDAFESLVGAYAAVEPYAEAWDNWLSGIDADAAARLGGLADTLSSTAAEVQRLDDAAVATLKERSDALNGEISRVGANRRAVKSYAPPAGERGPRFQDRSA